MAPAASLIAVLLLASGAGAARAQTSATGAIAGVVRNAAGEPLADALVVLEEQRGGTQSLFSDDRGRFRFSFLRPADYTLAIEVIGYAPTHTTDIPVRPGRDLRVDVVLDAVQTASPEPVIRRFAGGALRPGPGGRAQWLPRPETLPAERQELRDLGRLSSWTDESLGFEGLPASMSALLIDGAPFRPVRPPGTSIGAAAMTGFALHGFESAIATPVPLGVDVSAGAAGLLGAQTLAGTRAAQGRAEVRWSGDVLPGSSVENGDVPGFNEVQGSLALRGAAPGQGVRYAAGASLRRLERPFSRAWPEGGPAGQLLGAAAERGADVTSYPAPAALADRALDGFAAAGLRIGERHSLEASFHFASLPRLEVAEPRTGLLSTLEGTDGVGSLALRSAFGAVDNELRASLTSSVRESSASDSVPATYFVSEGLALGSSDHAARAAETAVRLGDALRLRAAGLTFTLGADALFAFHEVRRTPREDVFFGGLPQLQAQSGVLRRIEGGPPIADWSQPVYAVFGEARTTPAPGLSVRVGARAERQSLPNGEVRPDTTWSRYSPISNASADGGGWWISPRLGASWDLDREQRWIVELEGGLYHDRYDPLLLAAWQLDDGSARNRHVHSALDWPFGSPATGWTGRRLLILAPAFEPVRTGRVSGGLTHHLADGTALQVSAALRRTENLPRRTDLALLPEAFVRDQYGRSVYGTLVQQGSLLAGEPGSGRRLSEYDQIAIITSTASADYWGVTLGLEREVASGLSLTARYTYSGASDDWFGARDAGWGALAPSGLGEAWTDGRSDFDVPHRLAAGLFLDLSRVRLSALLRVESGLPFTPGFRYGVDANGDGDVGNDPAFIDPDLPGMAELLGAWPCLAESSGRFAARNGGRANTWKALDLAADARLLRFGRVSTSVLLEALGLLDTGREVPDAALYLVDPNGETVTGTSDVVTVPLLVNPDFGRTLTRRQPGRRLRVGLSLVW